jgi:hypothetical protein
MMREAQVTKLIPVGFFHELSDDPDERRTLPSLCAALSQTPHDDEARIVSYLKSGICVGARGCYVEDVLDPSSKAPLHAHLYTDGTYLWRSDIAHYVEQYHLRLPLEFVHHMAAMNWHVPDEEEVDVDLLEV